MPGRLRKELWDRCVHYILLEISILRSLQGKAIPDTDVHGLCSLNGDAYLNKDGRNPMQVMGSDA